MRHPVGSREQLAQTARETERARKAEIRRQAKRAVQLGTTLPYSLATLIDAGVGVVAIRKVYRREPG